MAFHMQLQAVGTLRILGKEGFAYFGNPLGGTCSFVVIYRTAGPKRDIVEIEKAVVGAAIY